MNSDEPRNYDYDRAESMILKAFGDKLRRGEHVFISEDDSKLYFRKSIRNANEYKIDLDEDSIPHWSRSGTIPRHMAQRGFSCRVGVRVGSKYVELWFPKRRIQEKKSIKRDALTKYHGVWFMRLYGFDINYTEFEIYVLPDNVKELLINDFELKIRTENTQNISQKLINIKKLPISINLCLPHWIMDKLKEAMEQYVNGQWFSSIMLCGAIVEFFTNSFFIANKEKLPKGERNKSNSVIKNIEKLEKYRILDKDDSEILLDVRRIRDDHTHLKVLREDKKLLKLQNIESLTKLLSFFNQKNIFSKYSNYIRYLVIYSNPCVEDAKPQ